MHVPREGLSGVSNGGATNGSYDNESVNEGEHGTKCQCARRDTNFDYKHYRKFEVKNGSQNKHVQPKPTS